MTNPDALIGYTAQELAERNGQIRPEIWIAYKGLIYDVTHSKLFKGGKHFPHSTGVDLTQELEGAPHTERVFENLAVVGKLV